MRVTLETQRLILRPFTLDDAQDMFDGWASDPEVTKYLTWETHSSVEDTKDILRLWTEQYEKPERLNFAIETKDEHKLIGGIDVNSYDNGVPVIGYDLSRRYRNNGYMTEACRCVLEYLFSKGYDKVRIDAVVENSGSNRVIQKCGGELIKTEEVRFRMKNNKVFMLNRYIIKNEIKGETENDRH